ncbi:MAG: NAD+ synthase [Maricaulaceae bacterium]
MTDWLRIATAQLNPTMGDVSANLAQARAARAAARESGFGGADIIVFPELFLLGYPPEDLVYKPTVVEACRAAAQSLAADTADGGPAVLIGLPWAEQDRLFNAVALMDEGRIHAVRFKRELPNYGVFDEKRVFEAGPLAEPVTFKGAKLGLAICEDIWLPAVPRALARQGAEFIIAINGSPWRRGIEAERLAAFNQWRGVSEAPLVFVNMVGAQDELVFDGASFCTDGAGRMVRQLPQFEACVDVVDWVKKSGAWRCEMEDEPEFAPWSDGLDAVYRAVMAGVGDYVRKSGFEGVLLGLSGGIDSALTAAIAVDALGPEHVWGVMLPSRFTSRESLEDADAVARKLGIRLMTVGIEPGVEALDEMLHEAFQGTSRGVTEENIQSRLRGTALMALSNKFGRLLLTTGNKSELAVGYATLYGDMNGAFNPLKDLYKTDVYALARWRNAHAPRGGLGPDGPAMPERVIEKPPSAELAPGQTDQDSLPPYDVLDEVLKGLIEHDRDVQALVVDGHNRAIVEQVERLLYASEYKRRQSAPGVKVGPALFNRDRRYPIVNRFRSA